MEFAALKMNPEVWLRPFPGTQKANCRGLLMETEQLERMKVNTIALLSLFIF